MRLQLQTSSEIREQIWKELARACKDRHHAWRTPVIATTDLHGIPHARTVVLRNVDVGAEILQIYTDARSPKVRDLSSQPSAEVVFWSARLHWQIRARVVISIVTQGPELERLWERVAQSASAADYLGALAPGVLISDADASYINQQQTPHFAILNARVTEIDWLELVSTGHRRAKFTTASWEWLTP